MGFKYRVVRDATHTGLQTKLDNYAKNDPSFRVYGICHDGTNYCALVRENDSV